MRPRQGPIKGLNRVVGVDVAKATVVLFDSQTQRTCKVSNESQALRRALSAYFGACPY